MEKTDEDFQIDDVFISRAAQRQSQAKKEENDRSFAIKGTPSLSYRAPWHPVLWKVVQSNLQHLKLGKVVGICLGLEKVTYVCQCSISYTIAFSLFFHIFIDKLLAQNKALNQENR